MKKISNTIKGICEWIKTFLGDKFNAGLIPRWQAGNL